MDLHLASPWNRGLTQFRNGQMAYNLAICTFIKSRLFPLLSGAMEDSQKGRLRLNDSNSMLTT